MCRPVETAVQGVTQLQVSHPVVRYPERFRTTCALQDDLIHPLVLLVSPHVLLGCA